MSYQKLIKENARLKSDIRDNINTIILLLEDLAKMTSVNLQYADTIEALSDILDSGGHQTLSIVRHYFGLKDVKPGGTSYLRPVVANKGEMIRKRDEIRALLRVLRAQHGEQAIQGNPEVGRNLRSGNQGRGTLPGQDPGDETPRVTGTSGDSPNRGGRLILPSEGGEVE